MLQGSKPRQDGAPGAQSQLWWDAVCAELLPHEPEQVQPDGGSTSCVHTWDLRAHTRRACCREALGLSVETLRRRLQRMRHQKLVSRGTRGTFHRRTTQAREPPQRTRRGEQRRMKNFFLAMRERRADAGMVLWKSSGVGINYRLHARARA